MEAIVILAIFGGYLAVAVFTVRAVVRWHAKNGATKTQRWLWGGAVALAFYLVPFWDLLPTHVGHAYLCASKGRFEVRKPLELWKQENRDVLSTLRYDRDAKIVRVGDYDRFPLNQRLVVERKHPTEVFLTIKHMEGRIVDLKNGEILASYVDFGTPDTSGKFWLITGRCRGESRGVGHFMLIEKAIQRLGGDA